MAREQLERPSFIFLSFLRRGESYEPGSITPRNENVPFLERENVHEKKETRDENHTVLFPPNEVANP